MIRALRTSVTLGIGWLLLAGGTADAHEKHAGHGSTAAAPDARADTLVPPAPPPSGAEAEAEVAEPPFEMPPMMEAMAHHLHNKLVHFPIVFTLLAFLSLVLARGRVELHGLARTLAWLAVLSAAGAVWAGLGQAGDFEGEPKAWLVLAHRNWGLATMASLVVTAVLTLRPATIRHAWVPGLLAAALVSVAGYLGGLVSHG